MQLDDVVDAVTVHGVCGAWGTLAAGIFFEKALFNLDIILVQALGVGAALIWDLVHLLLCLNYSISSWVVCEFHNNMNNVVWTTLNMRSYLILSFKEM